MIWFIVLNTLMTDGTLYTEVQFPNTPEYNNEKTCNEVGNELMEQEQMKIGTNAGTVYFICKELGLDQVRKATGKAGSNS